MSSNLFIALQVVADQIRLWQADAQRVRQTRAVLYDDFSSVTLFEKTLSFAQQLGALLWDDRRGCGRLVARAEAHDQIRDFIKANK
jgi:Transcription factor Tfb2 (p52) C-terminal domain